MIKKFTESVVCSMAYDIDSHKFSIRLKTLRKENKMTQDALAQKLAITQTQISRYESGTDRPSPEILLKLGAIFHVTQEYMRGEVVAEDPLDYDEDEDSLAHRVKVIRTYFNKSQDEFAKELAISQSALSAIERGQGQPGTETLQKLGRMGFDLNWILYGESNGGNTPENIIEKTDADREKTRILKILDTLPQNKLRVLRQCLELITKSE